MHVALQLPKCSSFTVSTRNTCRDIKTNYYTTKN